MRDSLKSDKKIHMEAYQRIQNQNVQLLRDINILRKMESNILIQRETYDQLKNRTDKMRVAYLQSNEDDELLQSNEEETFIQEEI